LRLAAGIGSITYGIDGLRAGPPLELATLHAIEIAAGILLIAGLWTPVSGTLLAVLGIWHFISKSGDPWAAIFLGTMGAALALLGPGAWSVDARLFGWKRIDIRDRER
jgi:putative oxidoreductase